MTERKERYKLYKAKKLWVTAMIATGIFIGTSVAIDPVNAATQTAVASSSAGTSASVANTSSVNSSASVASATSSSAMLSVSEGSNAATSSANSSAISNSASQSPAASSSTANSAATSSNTASSTAASQGSNAAVNTATSSVNSSATSSSASQSPVASSSTANSAATSSNTASSTAASQGSSAASSSSATTSSTKVALKLNVLAATSTSLQSVATSSSVSSRHLTDNNFADKDGSTPLTAPTFMTSSGDFEMSLELSGQTGDVFTFTLPTDQSDTSAYPVVINENSLEGGSSYNITSSSNHQIVITFKSNGIVTFPIKLHYLLGSKETPAGAAGWYYGKQIRQMTLSGVDGRGESLGTVTKDITLDNTISPSITAKRVINSSTIVNNVDYEYQASVTNLPQNNTIFLTMGNDNPVTFTVTMPTGFVLNETYTNKKMDALLGAGNYSIAYDQASGVLSVTVSDPAKTFGKSKASSVVADFVGHYENQSGTDTATAGPSINGVLGSNQVPFQATGTALSETFKTSEASEGDINFTYKYAHPDNQQIKLNNDQHAYLAEIGVRSNKTTTVTNQDLQLTMPTEFDVNANQLTLSHQIYGTGADSTKLTYTVKYADGSSKNYTYGDTPFSDLPAQRISQITLHIAELDPSEEYDVQINGTVDTSVAKDGDEASIEYSLANQGTTVSSPSKLTQTIVTTPAATGTLWTYPVNTIAGSDANGNNSSRWELGETIGNAIC